MRAEMNEKTKALLSNEQTTELEKYAERLLTLGHSTPAVDDTTEVVMINLQKLEKVDAPLMLAGVRVHFSGGHMWQKSDWGFPTKPMDALPGGIYPVAWLRGTREAAVLDVVSVAV